MGFTMWLRVRNCLLWVACVEAVIFVIVVAMAAGHGDLGKAVKPDPSMDLTLPSLFAAASLVTAFCATRFARALSEENEGHLPVVWTLPASRTRYAFALFGVGALGVLGAFAISLAMMGLFLAVFRLLPFVQVTADSGLQLVRYLLFPFAYYGLLTAFTASVARTGRGIVGSVWVGSLVIAALAAADFPQPWSGVFLAIDTINPLHYAGYHHTTGADTTNIMAVPPVGVQLSLSGDIAALAAIALVGYVLGVWQWRRLEA